MYLKGLSAGLVLQDFIWTHTSGVASLGLTLGRRGAQALGSGPSALGNPETGTDGTRNPRPHHQARAPAHIPSFLNFFCYQLQYHILRSILRAQCQRVVVKCSTELDNIVTSKCRKKKKNREFPLWYSGNESDWYPWGCGFNPWPRLVGRESGLAVNYGIVH